jgi:hypothetical protein
MIKKVAVVILNWNGRKYLEKFLPSVIKYSSALADIYVADNASTDDSVEFLRSNFPEVKIILNTSNGGFSKGYNDALNSVEAEYYVLLNSDIEVRGAWIEPVLELMDTDESIAAVQPKILSWHEPEKFEYAGASGGFIDRYGFPFCRGRVFQELEADQGQYNDTTEVFWATGACMFVRSDLYHRYGGLDEDFFAHMEEIDFCWRMKNLGYRIMVCPDSTVYHVGGGTLPKSSSRKTYLNFRNNLFLLYKNLHPKRLFPVFFIRFFLDGIASIKFLVEGGFKDYFAVFKAYMHFWGSHGKLRKKRRIITHSSASQIYKKSIVLDHFLRGKKKYSELEEKDFT